MCDKWIRNLKRAEDVQEKPDAQKTLKRSLSIKSPKKCVPGVQGTWTLIESAVEKYG